MVRRTSTPAKSSTLLPASRCKRTVDSTVTHVLILHFQHIMVQAWPDSWVGPGRSFFVIRGNESGSRRAVPCVIPFIIDEHPLTIPSYSCGQQRDLEHIQGLSRNGEDQCYPMLTDSISIPPRKTLRMFNMSCFSLWFALVTSLPESHFTGINIPGEGIRALEFYDPVAKKHGQAHMQARLGITRWLIKEGIARVEEIRCSASTLGPTRHAHDPPSNGVASCHMASGLPRMALQPLPKIFDTCQRPFSRPLVGLPLPSAARSPVLPRLPD